MPNIVASNPIEDSFKETLTQADDQVHGMSIADPKPVRLTERGSGGNDIYPPKRPGAHGSQDPEDISHIARREDMQQGRQQHLAYQEGLKIVFHYGKCGTQKVQSWREGFPLM